MPAIAALFIAASGCNRSNETLCVDRLCFDIPLNTPVRTQDQRHSIRPESAAGWIDVQIYSTHRTPSSDPAQLSAQLAQRLALAPAVTVLAHSTTTLARLHQVVAVNDLALQSNGARYRRRSWLVPSATNDGWTLIDVTALADRWAEAEQTLVPLAMAVHRL